uniref:Sulfotransferase domain-containing protein n=1 Tax=Phlebotomus papatasi TaxID=29031 RepID=A0A1B0GND5_PHLPP
MSIVCEKVPPSDLVEKSGYRGVKDFVLVNRTERPKDIKVAEMWCMEPCYMPTFYEDIAQRIEDFEVRPDDVWVVTFAKCGTTWTQEMVFQSLLAKELNLPDEIARTESMPSPRFIKSHLPAHLLPRKIWTVRPKIIYVARNTKDAAISFYHHYRNLHHYSGNFEGFMDAFLKDSILYSPFHSHIIDFWRMRNEENILFLTFEDMKRDHPSVIKKTAKFLGKSLSENQILELADYLSFAKFSKNPSVNMEGILKNFEKTIGSKRPDNDYNFVRKGVVGGFKEEMTPELIDRFNKWTESEVKKWNCDPELKQIFTISNKING